MMVRTQISLAADEHRRARLRAASEGISLAEYVRRLIARDLGEPAPQGDISAIFDLGDSGGSDVAAHEDAYVGAAFDALARDRG